MEYVKALLPSSLIRSVSSVSTSLARQVMPAPQPRPFRICTHDRCIWRSVTAASLDDLVNKSVSVLLLSCQFVTLVLEEDGTVVDTEDFFQSLPPNANFMVLEKGQIWTHNKSLQAFRKRTGIARLSFDLYKLSRKDFIGCLTIRATMYEIYTLSYDIQCMRMKELFKFLLRCLMHAARCVGQFLMCGSTVLLQYMEENEK